MYKITGCDLFISDIKLITTNHAVLAAAHILANCCRLVFVGFELREEASERERATGERNSRKSK